MSRARVPLSALNPAQREAVERIRGPVLILAGAGTGKTRVITTRIGQIVAKGHDPSGVLAVTFTNKAATEMRERVGGVVSKDAAKALTISTFHSLCVRILRSGIDRLGYKRNFTIYTASDQLGLLRKIIVRKACKDENLDPKEAQMRISAAKNSRSGEVNDEPDSLIADVYRSYRTELKQLNALDFDDLLLLAVELLEEHPEVRSRWQERFEFIMVDEFQDTNALQMRLLRQLAEPRRNVCVVGDDDQSIYGWRGAEISNILDFERFFPGPHVVKLEENYRSTNRILGLANSLIRHNVGRREKTLWSSRGDGEKTRLISMPDAEVEAETIVSELLTGRRLHGRRWEEFALLFRMNTQSRVFEEALRRQDIPYKVIGGQSFYERREVKDLLAYLALFLNPDDDVSLLRVINNPPRGIGNNTVALATDLSIDRQCSIFSLLQHTDFIGQLSTKGRNAVNRFVEFVLDHRAIVEEPTADYAAMANSLVEETGWLDYLRRSCKDANEAANRVQNVRELLEAMRHHRDKNASGGLRGFLDGVALMQDKEEREDDKEQGWGVSLITLHAAKGLEFPVVYLVGVEEGVLPHTRSVEEGSRDEERRLLYVGITRAMEDLTLTWCHSRKRWGDKVPCQPSSFFKELDPELLDSLTYEELAERPAEEDVAADYFARMKEMLSD